MKVVLEMSGNLFKEEVLSLLQAIGDWGKPRGSKTVEFTIGFLGLERKELEELLRDVKSTMEEYEITMRPSDCPGGGHRAQSVRRSPRGERMLKFGPRTVVVGDSVMGICGDLAITITEATDEEIESFKDASEIRLIKIMKG